MGNCIDTFSSPSQKRLKVVTFDGRKEEFPALTTVGNITSCGPYKGYKLVQRSEPKRSLPSDAKLRPGQVYYLIPPVMQQCRPPLTSQKTGKHGGRNAGKRVKIVLSKQQWELLIKNAKRFHPGETMASPAVSCVGQGRKKWRSSLATIPEYC